MKIRKKFLQLTKLTYPFGFENLLEPHLPKGYKKDNYGNYYLSVGDNYTTMFTCHLDTASRSVVPVRHNFYGNYIATDGKSILGADDKAGMVVLLYMISKNIPGLYYFFTGEECGCIGSSDLAEAFAVEGDVPSELYNIKKVISFDRRGTSSVITYQLYGQCCSDEFADALCFQLNQTNLLKMKPDDSGVMTDSAQFVNLIPECTNISVGYYEEHTIRERQDIQHLYNLCRSLENVDFESLPIKRDPESTSRYSFDWDDYESPYESGKNITPVISKDQHLTKTVRSLGDFSDDLYTYVIVDGVRKKAFVSQTWIAHEKLSIIGVLQKQGRKIDEIYWDGSTCFVRNAGENHREYIGNRNHFIPFIDDFDRIPLEHLTYDLVFVT
jgi:hypothetical protein